MRGRAGKTAIVTGAAGGFGSPLIARPDAERGQLVAAVAVGDGELDFQPLRQHFAAELSSYKLPRRILRLRRAVLPVLPNGKVDMPKLRMLLLERT